MMDKETAALQAIVEAINEMAPELYAYYKASGGDDAAPDLLKLKNVEFKHEFGGRKWTWMVSAEGLVARGTTKYLAMAKVLRYNKKLLRKWKKEAAK